MNSIIKLEFMPFFIEKNFNFTAFFNIKNNMLE